MDKFDLKILKELETNVKISHNQIGKKISRSQQFVDYRIKLMKTKEPDPVFSNQVIINPYKLNMRSFFLLIKLDKLKDSPNFLEKLKKRKNVNWIIKCGYDYDWIIMLTVKKVDELYDFVSSILKIKKVHTYDLKEINKFDMMTHKYITGNLGSIENTVLSEVTDIDGLDKKLLNLLSENLEEKIVNIANKLGVSYKTVQARIKRLEENGVISGYRTFINPRPFNHKTHMITFTSNIKSSADLEIFMKYIQENKYITDSFEFMGRYSNGIIIRTPKVSNYSNINELIDELRSKVPRLEDVTVRRVFNDSLFKSIIL